MRYRIDLLIVTPKRRTRTMNWREVFRKKTYAPEKRFLRRLGLLDLTLLGMGAIIGAGIFVITGKAAATMAGPGIVFSFILGAITIGISALVYAELGSTYPVSGSAYSYSYVTIGEIVAWIVGWELLLEYGIATSTVASGWSGYLRRFLEESLGVHIPLAISGAYDPASGTYIDFFAFFIVILIFILLTVGIKKSAVVNSIIVGIKIIILLLFVSFGLASIKLSNFKVFLPYGWSGVWHASSLIVFAYLGFDAVSTVAEETKNPKKNLPLGLVLSLAISTFFYIVVSLALTGMVSYKKLDVPDALAFAMYQANHPFVASIISLGAVITILSVMLVMGLGFTRVAFALARDGLLFKGLADIHGRFKTPYKATICGGILLSLLAGLVPLRTLAELVNIGTLFAYFIAGISVIISRRNPNTSSTFKIPCITILMPVNLALLMLIMAGLPLITWLRFVLWTATGLFIYFMYGFKHSNVRRKAAK